jgi:hypothetical protein
VDYFGIFKACFALKVWIFIFDGKDELCDCDVCSTSVHML